MLVPCGPIGPPAPVNSGVRLSHPYESRQMTKAIYICAALILSAVLPTVLFVGNSGHVQVQSTLSEATGTLKFIARYRSNPARIEVQTAQRKLTFICPINVRSFPCDDPQVAFSLVASGPGTVRFYKYDVATIDAGQGVIESIQIGSSRYQFPR
jgi:hypothetical protein